MHICIVGPVFTKDLAEFLEEPVGELPCGYVGAPFISLIISELIKRGHSVSVVTTSQDMELCRGGVRVVNGHGVKFFLVPSRPKAWPLNGFRLGRILDLYSFERSGLKTVLKEIGPDVVHAHWSYEFAWAAQDSGVPCLITCHDHPVTIARFYRDKPWKYRAYRWLRALMAWWVFRRARFLTTVSPYMQQALASMTRVPIALVPNPVRSALFDIQREDPPGRKRVLMVCNGWDSRKNPETALRAFSGLSSVMPEAELVLCGNGFGAGEAAQQYWEREGFQGQVMFLGGRPYSEVLAWMARSDVLLHPSLEESFGAVLAEAMACGLPVIAGKHSGAVPWVLGDAGFLLDVTDVDAMQRALHDVLLDAPRRQVMATRGREQVRSRFSPEAVTDAYEAQYAATLLHWEDKK